VHGARALVKVSRGREGGPWAWIDGLPTRRRFNVVAVAVANELARVARALPSRGEDYRTAAA
jgi:transposase